MNYVKELLMTEGKGFWIMNKNLVKIFGGFDNAGLLGVFADAEKFFPDNDGWFFQTIETVENETGLSRKRQDTIIKQLISINVLEQKNLGIPRKRYFRLNYEVIESILKNHDGTNVRQMSESGDKLVCPKRANCNVPKGQTVESEKGNYKEHNINNVNKEKKKEKRKGAKAPTFSIINKSPEELIEYYQQYRKSPEPVLDFAATGNQNHNVYLTHTEWDKLQVEYYTCYKGKEPATNAEKGEAFDLVDEGVNILDCFIENCKLQKAGKGLHYKNHYLVLRGWVLGEAVKRYRLKIRK